MAEKIKKHTHGKIESRNLQATPLYHDKKPIDKREKTINISYALILQTNNSKQTNRQREKAITEEATPYCHKNKKLSTTM